MGKSYVYCVTHKASGKKYVGYTINFPKRFAQHRYEARTAVNPSQYFTKAVRKYGVQEFHWGLYGVYDSEEEGLATEASLISLLRSLGYCLYNIAAGGVADRHSAESKAKLSIALMGNQNGLGKKYPNRPSRTEATKKKISESNKGRPVSEETKKKISIANSNPSDDFRKRMSAINSNRSTETRDRLSKALTGKRASAETRAKQSASQKARFERERLRRGDGLG